MDTQTKWHVVIETQLHPCHLHLRFTCSKQNAPVVVTILIVHFA